MSNNIDYNDLDGGSAVGRKRAGFGGKLGMGALAVLVVGGLVYVNWPKTPVSRESTATDDEFRTSTFQPPNLPEAPKAADVPTDQIVVPVPNEQQEATQAANTDQTVVQGDDLDAQRRQLEQQMALEAERKRQAEEEARLKREAEEAERQAAEEERLRKLVQERLQSNQMIFDGQSENTGSQQQAATVAPDGQLIPVPGADSDPNKAFLAQSESASNSAAVAVINRRTDALIAEGTLIRGFLETAMNTDLPGMVRAVVREDVYSLDGRRVLIPKGSRLVGEYKSGLARGQKRVFVVWNRMIRSDGVSVRIGSPGTDNLGRAGMSGRIDTHWLERYGNAIMLSIVGGAAEYVSSLGDKNNDQQRTVTITDPITGAVTTTTIGGNNSNNDARSIAFDKSSTALQQLANEAFRDSQNIGPTIHIDQGTPVIVFLRRDLDFSALYADPVQQELARMKRGGQKRTPIDPTPLYMTPKDNVPLSPDYFPSKP